MTTLKANPLSNDNLYQIHTISDPQTGTILWHVPIVVSEGPGVPARDPLRMDVFLGTCVLQTPRGPMNISFPLEATTLREAIDAFPAGVVAAVEQMQQNALRNRIATGGGAVNGKAAIDLSKLNNSKKN